MTRLAVMNEIKRLLTELEALERAARDVELRVMIEVHYRDGEKSYTPIFIEERKNDPL